MRKEVELKYRLGTLGELNAVLEVVNSTEVIIQKQINHFFDTHDFSLRKNSISLRLREQNEAYILSAKGPAEKKNVDKDGLSVRLEYEYHLPQGIAKKLLKEKLNPLEVLLVPHENPVDDRTREHLLSAVLNVVKKPHHIMRVGSFYNNRRCLPIKISGVDLALELDETIFDAHTIHYEVELEVPMDLPIEKAKEWLLGVLNKAKVSPFLSSGKAERFYDVLRKKS